MPFDANFWNEHYLQNTTTWDMGRVSPPLAAYFSQLPNKNCSILIPGCGNSYEAAWLLEHRFTSVTLIDISEALIHRLRQVFAATPDPPLQIITGDFFRLTGQYDLIIEQTFFCALDPSLREKYMDHMHRLLRPGGKLAGLLFNRSFVDGPPFGGHKAEYHKLLEKKFRVKTLAPCYNSITPRAGSELFFIAEKPTD
jgi:SAM-dependent methyltransferase